MERKKDIIRGIIAQKQIIYLIFALLIVVGLVGLFFMNKDEFPAFDIKQGLVVGVYPGAGAKDVEQQLTKPLEDILFSFSEVNRETTYSYSKDGICYIYVDLIVHNKRKNEVWSKIKLKLDDSRMLLPPGVLAVAVLDDFSAVSAILVGLESSDKSYREMAEYAEDLSKRLKSIKTVSNVSILGEQSEEIAVVVDRDKLSSYGISPSTLLLNYQTAGLKILSGNFKTDYTNSPIHFQSKLTNEEEIANHIVYTDPNGNVVRLSDVATVERRYKEISSMVKYNGQSALVLSIEMRPGNDIVAFGRKVNAVLNDFAADLPENVHMSRITDQSKVVSRSVFSFLRDLLISMAVVVFVMLMLFPMRSAMIASSGVPVCTAVAIAVMFMTGIDLNTVSLAALIVVLGMIVDDSIITMDGYMDKLGKGMSRTEAASQSSRELFVSMLTATAAICLMFFPACAAIKGNLGEFVGAFPWVISIALTISLVYAMLVVPSLEVKYITEAHSSKETVISRMQDRLFNALQGSYDKLEVWCFRHPRTTILGGLGFVAIGVLFFLQLNIQMMPMAARDFFAIEVCLENNAGLKQTEAVNDSLQKILLADRRVKSVTSFIGTGAPRFNAIYAPIMPGPNIAQLIVSTRSHEDTEAVLTELADTYGDAFPGTVIRFKQMNYQYVIAPVCVELTGASQDELKPYADSIRSFMQTMQNELQWVHSDCDGYVSGIEVVLDPEESSRLGVNKTMLSLSMAASLSGQTITSIWEDGKSVPVNLYSELTQKDGIDYDRLENQMISTLFPEVSVPLRQVASLQPTWELENYPRRAGVETVSVMADLKYGKSQPAAMKKIQHYIDTEIRPTLPPHIKIENGGLANVNKEVIPEIALAFFLAVMVLFFFMLFKFKKISLSLLTLALCTLCFFGAFAGLVIFHLDFGLTAVLGLISLVGIIVRNGIIMFDYAEELRLDGTPVKEAAFKAGQRRMRPIFLTSCTTALGVLPMVLNPDPLWRPMGVVICFGTILTIILIVTVMPVSYWLVFKNVKRKEGIDDEI